jgi:hypothetical protein
MLCVFYVYDICCNRNYKLYERYKLGNAKSKRIKSIQYWQRRNIYLLLLTWNSFENMAVYAICLVPVIYATSFGYILPSSGICIQHITSTCSTHC